VAENAFKKVQVPCEAFEKFKSIRSLSVELCKNLSTEDYVIQSDFFVSPPKWHLAHTTWFFENFILCKYLKGYQPFHPGYDFLFNSYYETVGEVYPRSKRGLLSRPTVNEIFAYRDHIDQAMQKVLSEVEDPGVLKLLEVGLHHEQQHQELLLMDIKYNFAMNPLKPAYAEENPRPLQHESSSVWIENEGGLLAIGAFSSDSFVYDNELPRHEVFLRPFQIANRLVTSGEYLEFMKAGGYKKPQYWLSDGWTFIKTQKIECPLYWTKKENHWFVFTLRGERKVHEAEPVCHISFYEADAFARWKGLRLPTEFEWEVVASKPKEQDNFLEKRSFHPLPSSRRPQMHGDVWQWTQSSYEPYPGYEPYEGSLGEYNGKFMCNQKVLRGGSCLTPQKHYRSTYRNFFFPQDRWPVTGLRLARDAK